MKRTTRTLSLVLAIALALLAFVGCSATGKTTDQTSPSQPTVEPLKEAKLIMYLVGDAQPDAGLVYDEVNKKLKTDINATVNVKYLSWADWDSKYSLIFASGEEFDCIYTASWAFYADQANKKGFLELNQDMLKANMPDYYKLVSTDFWDQVKVNDKIFMIPYLNKQVVGNFLAFTRGDLAEKYSIPEIKTLPDFENYVKTVLKNEKGMIGFDGSISELKDFVMNVLYKQPDNLMIMPINPPVFSMAMDDLKGKINFTLDDPNYLKAMKKAKEYSDAGFWSKNVLASTVGNGDNFNAGKSAFYSHQAENMIVTYGSVMNSHPEWKPVVTDLYPDKIHEMSGATRSGMAIHATSKNVERTLMMLNLFGTHKDYYDLTTYGITGKHFTPVGDDNKLKSTEEGLKKFAPTANCPWGWENKAFMRYPEIVPDSITNLQNDWLKNGLASTTPVVAFNFIDSNVKNELAACDSIWKADGLPLIAGLMPDTEAGLKKLKDNLKAAGIEKIQAELQTQLTAYLDSLK